MTFLQFKDKGPISSSKLGCVVHGSFGNNGIIVVAVLICGFPSKECPVPRGLAPPSHALILAFRKARRSIVEVQRPGPKVENV